MSTEKKKIKPEYKFDKFAITDCHNRVGALNNKNIFSNIFIEIPISIEQTEVWAASIASDFSRRDFVLRDNLGAAIAFAGLVNISSKHGTCELYIFLGSEHIGKGIGSYFLSCLTSYAYHELNLRKITLFVSGENVSIQDFYEKHGFICEGILKKHIWHRGRYVNRYLYSLFLEPSKLVDIYSILDSELGTYVS